MKLAVFLSCSLALIYISRASLLHPRSHGFYRFLAWECMLALFLFNAKFWFRDPFAWNQIIAWALLFASLIPLGYGIRFLRTRGKPADKREGDDSLLAFEKTTTLVTSGVYRYIRHPLYSSLLLLNWGIHFKDPLSMTGIMLAIAATIFLFATAKADEAECIQFFGNSYREYMKTTKMFVPFIF